MCSIFGVIGKEPKAKEAFFTLAHRGEDSFKYINENEYFFGSHRLAIESFNKEQNQPLIKGNYIALFNGEIYNYKKLIKKFKLNATDEIETILELFLLKKEKILKYLRGMFAIAIFNKDTNELFLFRDLVGKKPLFYTFFNNKFYFASEQKALQKILGFNLEKRAIHQFLGFGATISPNTLQKDIKKVEISSYLYFDGKNIINKRYEPFLKIKPKITNLKTASKELEKTLLKAINLRIPKNINWGVLLSGGLDSSLIAALCAKSCKQKINLFSIGYEGYEKYDERAYAKEVAKHLDANFYSFNFTKKDFFNTIEKMLNILDEPLGDPAQIPLFFLISKAKEQNIKVLLSGDGSDELFLGYRVYKEYLSMQKVSNLPYANWLKNFLRAHFSLNKEWEWYKRALNKEVVFRSSCELYTDRQLNMLLRLQEKDNKNFEFIKKYRDDFSKNSNDYINWFSYLDLKVQLGEYFLTKIDRVSMANGIEVRSPFLDKKVIKLAFKINSNIRFNPTNVKPVVKEVAKNYLPNSIVNRKKKGLNYPFIEWILEENGLDVIYQANEKFNIFKTSQLDFLSSKASSGKFKQHLFPLFILSLWLLKNKKN
jgi:asparagine synthase (glutamine-hydrolysing)